MKWRGLAKKFTGRHILFSVAPTWSVPVRRSDCGKNRLAYRQGLKRDA